MSSGVFITENEQGKKSPKQLASYTNRIQDLGVVVDCLPVLTNSLQEEKPYVSVGCCVDLLPLVKSLLKSKYEEYVIVGLNWLQAVIKRWWSELSAHTEKAEDGTDGSFVVHDVPSGSYVVEVISPAHKFEPVRVDITSKGKMRARYVNYIKPSEVVRLPYPLQMKSSGPPSYFIKRESWGWTDFLMNPMVMMMVLPLLIFVLLPKVVNTSDPDMRREMEQSMNMLNSNHELPDVSEFMTRLFSSKSSSKSGGSSSKTGKSSSGKRR
ncbi:ER membrane protein complex subunit 7 [Pitangus sulphuratus]|nr:ER membrane protein complex subunit 7 [Pitangus sulphuratus]